uniref:transposase domain-containing protein n=1 Tax=Thomasclavelia ramosa TaxID=1547 RepID=UPI00402ADE8A
MLYTAALAFAPFGLSLNNQFLLLCAIEHNWKNRLFANTVKGAETSASIYTILETAKLNNLKPYEYFEYLLTTVIEINLEEKEIEKIMPWLEMLLKKCTSQKFVEIRSFCS